MKYLIKLLILSFITCFQSSKYCQNIGFEVDNNKGTINSIFLKNNQIIFEIDSNVNEIKNIFFMIKFCHWKLLKFNLISMILIFYKQKPIFANVVLPAKCRRFVENRWRAFLLGSFFVYSNLKTSLKLLNLM